MDCKFFLIFKYISDYRKYTLIPIYFGLTIILLNLDRFIQWLTKHSHDLISNVNLEQAPSQTADLTILANKHS